MKSVQSWCVSGVAQDVQDVAREAARRSGQPLGEWLNEVILHSAAQIGVSPRDASSGLEQQLRLITEQIETLRRPCPFEEDAGALLSRAVEMLTEKAELMAGARADAASLQNIERAIAEPRGLAARAASSDAFLALAREIERLASAVSARGREDPSHEESRRAATAEDVEALKHDLNALREVHLASDQRTQDSLDVLHRTLQQVADCLAAIETGTRTEPLSGNLPLETPNLAVSPPEPPTASAAQTHLQGVMAGSDTRPHVRPSAIAMGAGPQRVPLMPSGHHWQEGLLSPLSGTKAQEPTGAHEEAPDRPAPAGLERSSKANFIAAARRAAQAAAETGERENADPPERTPASPFGLVRQALKGRGRHFMLVLGSFFLAAAAVQLAFDLAGGPASAHLRAQSDDLAGRAFIGEQASPDLASPDLAAATALPAAGVIGEALHNPDIARLLHDGRDWLRSAHRQKVDRFLARHGIAGMSEVSDRRP